MPLAPSVAALLDVLPSRLAEACTPPFAILEIEDLPPARIDRFSGRLVCGAHGATIANARDWRAAARPIVRLADAAACDLNLERVAERHLESVMLPPGSAVAVGASGAAPAANTGAIEVMPTWAWKIDASLLQALQDLGMQASEILACAATPGATITFPAGQGTPGLTANATVEAVGRFPLIEVSIELRPGLLMQAKAKTVLKVDRKFPHTISSALAGSELTAVVEVGVEAVDRMLIGTASHAGGGTTWRLGSALAPLAPVPTSVIAGLPPHMREWFYSPRWGRAPALLADALGLLAAR
jgi:hypothetical protein